MYWSGRGLVGHLGIGGVFFGGESIICRLGGEVEAF